MRVLDWCVYRPVSPMPRKWPRSGNKLRHRSRCVMLLDVVILAVGCRHAGGKGEGCCHCGVPSHVCFDFRRMSGCRAAHSKTNVCHICLCCAVAGIAASNSMILLQCHQAEIEGLHLRTWSLRCNPCGARTRAAGTIVQDHTKRDGVGHWQGVLCVPL